MNDGNTVSLKIYVMEGNVNTEIRRFEVDQSVITNYDYMRERLQLAIPKLREKVFKLLWQDTDGDEVMISSDEELMIALSEFKSNVCKFIVRLETENEETEAHISFRIPNMHDIFSSFSNLANGCPLFAELQTDQNCHSCQQPISGFRYRCLECVQYYQCGDCEHKNAHPDHVMLRISKDPSLSVLIPKCMHILKSHFIRGSRCAGMQGCSFLKEKFSHCHKEDKEKEKRGHHHHRRFRKHGHGEKHASQSDDPVGECPFNEEAINNLGNVIGTFLGMYKDSPTTKPSETTNASIINDKTPTKVINLDSPPMPSAPEDSRMDEDSTGPSTSSAQSQKEAKIKMAVELLSEMGFNDENKWLSRLLEHFDGDIAKTIDHLTLGK